NAVVVQPNGEVVVAGTATTTSTVGGVTVTTKSGALACLLANGSPDAAFGQGGQTTLDIPGAQMDEVESATLAPNGEIVVAGTTDAKAALTHDDELLARLTSTISVSPGLALDPKSDTGVPHDQITDLPNPSFDVSSVAPGVTVELFRDGTKVGSVLSR